MSLAATHPNFARLKRNIFLNGGSEKIKHLKKPGADNILAVHLSGF
ncbi:MULTISPECIES: hypothetical protein [unclassified Microcoleus]